MVLPSACPAAAASYAFDDATELPPLVIIDAADDGLNGDDEMQYSSLLDEGAEELNLPTAASEGHNGCVRGSRTAEAQCVYYYDELKTHNKHSLAQ